MTSPRYFSLRSLSYSKAMAVDRPSPSSTPHARHAIEKEPQEKEILRQLLQTVRRDWPSEPDKPGRSLKEMILHRYTLQLSGSHAPQSLSSASSSSSASSTAPPQLVSAKSSIPSLPPNPAFDRIAADKARERKALQQLGQNKWMKLYPLPQPVQSRKKLYSLLSTGAQNKVNRIGARHFFAHWFGKLLFLKK